MEAGGQGRGEAVLGDAMKQAVAEHPKLYRLCGLLKTSRRDAIGALELLWRFTALYSPAGDIGRHDDFTIAKACDHEGDPSEFIHALRDSGWLDECSDCRFVIHDWKEHCAPWVAARLKKINRKFFVANKIRHGSIEPSIERSIEGTSRGSKEKRSKGKKSKEEEAEIPSTLDTPEFRLAWAEWEQHRHEKRIALTPLAVKKQLKILAGIGATRAIGAINHSIANGYKGIFESKETGNGKQSNRDGAGQSYQGSPMPDAPSRHPR